MRILIANDDGIESEGLTHLAKMASRMGEVWVVAPEGQRSAMSQRITVFGTILLHEVEKYCVPDVHAFTISGTPADCVKVALSCVMPQKPDIVFAGINDGYNVGKDILYSGTVGVAMEALSNDLPVIAFSVASCGDLRLCDASIPDMAEDLIKKKLPPGEFWNVNFPSCAPEECKGILENRFPSLLQYYFNKYTKEALPEGGTKLTVKSRLCTSAESGSDMQAVLDGYISIGIVTNALLKQKVV